MPIPCEQVVIVEEKRIESEMDILDENMRVGSLVTKKPAYAALFEKMGIDYCCKGNKTLKELCAEKNLDAAVVLDKLRRISTTSQTMDWDKFSLIDLVIHIMEKHHDYLREELPRLSAIIHKVATKHGGIHPELIELRETFEGFKIAILDHLEKEETILFPAIEYIAKDKKSPTFEEGNIKSCLSSLDSEHVEAGAALEKMSKLTNEYNPPAGACTSYLVMLSGLAFLEKDVHEHVHRENQILFPRVLEEWHKLL